MLSAINGTGLNDAARDVIELGLQHEQQHQELILTDLKNLFSCNPLLPAYVQEVKDERGEAPALKWHRFEKGIKWIGEGKSGFAFDNERPRHQVFLQSFELASRPVTCGEFREFIGDGGYDRPELWLSDGWNVVQSQAWRSPYYWKEESGAWTEFTLSGNRPVREQEPVTHVSYYEADAYARWADARLPLEAEWEIAAEDQPLDGNFVESGLLHPASAGASEGAGPLQMFGDVWEWTGSSYSPYPGYKPAAGALGEYNGKFMSNQMVLRGGSCATPRSHIRSTYRNFFPPDARWQFSGIRLARDLG
jgi:ergothioneine biosynthesis protein EgtB